MQTFRTATTDVRVGDVVIPEHVARPEAAMEARPILTALARRVRTIELDGPTARHHNNTLRAWERIPVRVTLD